MKRKLLAAIAKRTGKGLQPRKSPAEPKVAHPDARPTGRAELTAPELQLLQSERGDATSWPAGDPGLFSGPAAQTPARREPAQPKAQHQEKAAPTRASAPPPPENAPRSSLVGQTVVIKGALDAAEDLVIAGQIEGSITHTAKRLIVGRTGVVKARIQARNLVVEGLVEGDIACRGMVMLKETANVTGNIHTLRLEIADGARFNGRIVMVQQKRRERD